MATAIIPFDFETHPVRVVMVGGEPVWVAADVCRCVEISKYRDAIGRLDEDERVSVSVDTLGGRQTMIGVPQSGLWALILMSQKPVAKRFRKWLTAEVVPALLRQGYYAMPGSLDADLADKRAYFATLPEAQRQRADDRVQMLARVEELISQGSRVREAVAAAAEESGLGKSTIFALRKAVYMVPRGDWPAALAPRWNGDRGMLAECHPEALRFYLDLVASGARPSHALRRTAEVAAERDWTLPSDRTLRRQAKRALPTPSKKQAA